MNCDNFFECPFDCTCQGKYEVYCNFPSLKSLNLNQYKNIPKQVTVKVASLIKVQNSKYILGYLKKVHLNFLNCSNSVVDIAFITEKFHNLVILDLSGTEQTLLNKELMMHLLKLQKLYLKRNLIKIISSTSFGSLGILLLDLSENSFSDVGSMVFSQMKKLEILSLNSCKIKKMHEHFLNGLKSLKILKMMKTEFSLEIKLNFFKHIKNIEILKSENIRVCCVFNRFFPKKTCLNFEKKLEFCKNILKNHFQEYFMQFSIFILILTNSISIILSILIKNYSLNKYIIHCTQIILGISLIIIISAHVKYGDDYIQYDKLWRMSFPCKFSGCLTSLFILGTTFSEFHEFSFQYFMSIFFKRNKTYLIDEIIFNLFTIFINLSVIFIPILFQIVMWKRHLKLLIFIQ